MGGTKQGRAKARQTMIDRHFNGDEAAYLEYMRQISARGGAKSGPNSPTNFKNRRDLAKQANKKSWGTEARERRRLAIERRRQRTGVEVGHG